MSFPSFDLAPFSVGFSVFTPTHVFLFMFATFSIVSHLKKSLTQCQHWCPHCLRGLDSYGQCNRSSCSCLFLMQNAARFPNTTVVPKRRKNPIVLERLKGTVPIRIDYSRCHPIWPLQKKSGRSIGIHLVVYKLAWNDSFMRTASDSHWLALVSL